MQIPTLEEINLIGLLPVIVLVVYAHLLLIVDLFIPGERRTWTALLGIIGLVITGVLVILQAVGGPLAPAEVPVFGGMLMADGFSLFLKGVLVISGIISILIAMQYLPHRGIERGEYYSLILFSTSGMMLMSMAADLIIVFIALELLSIPLYIMAGMARPQLKSEESAMKYFLLGTFSSAFLLYGVALVYGGTGSTRFTEVVAALQGGAANSSALLFVGLGLLLVGMGSKISAVPFHMWTPDVYQGAPTSVTAFMSAGAKISGMASLVRVLVTAFPEVGPTWGALVAVMAILTMILGNVVAVSQNDVKRMLGYSSIAHGGYLLVAIAAASHPEAAPFAVAAAIFYALTYTFTNLGAFAVVTAVENADGSGTDIKSFVGLGKRHFWLAFAMALFMLSLTGVPVSAGMVGKFFLFQAVWRAALIDPLLLTALFVAALTTVVSAFYYMRVIVVMFLQEHEGGDIPQPLALRPAMVGALALSLGGTLLLGILPTRLIEVAQNALLTLTG